MATDDRRCSNCFRLLVDCDGSCRHYNAGICQRPIEQTIQLPLVEFNYLKETIAKLEKENEALKKDIHAQRKEIVTAHGLIANISLSCEKFYKDVDHD